ncbi:glycosyltransferase [Patescibacteria group bacterium]|nr:glycosyltransferase [Patescibacteria group bacterium]
MNILLVSESFPPVVSGVAVATARLANELSRRGYTVTVMTAGKRAQTLNSRQNGYTVCRLPSWPNPFRSGLRFTFYPRRAVARVFDKARPDVVHLQDPLSLSELTATLAKRAGVPVVLTHHFTFEGGVLPYLPWLKLFHPSIVRQTRRRIYRLYNRTTVITVPSSYIQRQLSDPGLTTPVRVLSNGVELDRFLPPDRTNRDTFSLLYLGRLDPEKNVSVLLQAMAGLIERKIKLTIVGAGNLESRLRQEADRSGVSDQINWISPVKREDEALTALYAQADVFCMPSVGESESIATMEAMASGLPILAAQAAALPELVSDGENGYLLPPDNAAAWTEAILKLYTKPDRRREMGEAGRKKVEERDFYHIVDCWEQIYRELADLKG